MKLQYWVLTCAATAAATFAGCSYHRAERADLASPAQGLGFFLVEEGGSAKLAYGVANSDDVGLMMECAKGSSRVLVSDVARTPPAREPELILASAGERSKLKAKVSEGLGQPLLTAVASTETDALEAFRKSGRIEVAYSGFSYRIAARDEERPVVRRFFDACEGRRA